MKRVIVNTKGNDKVIGYDKRFDEIKKVPQREYNPEKDDIEFLQFDIDYINRIVEKEYRIEEDPLSEGYNEPVLYLYGTTNEGDSVLAMVHGYKPYFYISVEKEYTQQELDELKMKCNQQLHSEVKATGDFEQYILLMENVKGYHSLMNYNFEKETFFVKITLRLPKYVPVLRHILQETQRINNRHYQTYEADLLFVLRFMVDAGLVGCSWVKVPAKRYILVKDEANKISRCQHEIHLDVKDLLNLGCDNEYTKTAPLRILSFDIECAGRKGSFPVPELDPVIQIANYVVEFGKPDIITKNVFVLKGCSPIPGAIIYDYDTEEELLKGWSDFINAIDVDVFTGYNIMNFDFKYLLERAKVLKVKDFSSFSKLKSSHVSVRQSTFQSKAVGVRESNELINLEGRIPFDMFQVIQHDYKLRSYTLNFVSSNFLGDQKEEVHYADITTLHEGSMDDRNRIAVYCLKDTYLPIKLLEKLMSLVNGFEMCRVTGIPLSYLLPRGQQVKVITQLYRHANAKKLFIPFFQRTKTNGDKYVGATVISPIKGFYKVPISTLDFSSLYPSIMISHNLCYSTLIDGIKTRKDVPSIEFLKTSESEEDRKMYDQIMKKLKEKQLNVEDVELSPNGDLFVKSSKRKGILPEILENLLAARKQAKKDMAAATDPFKITVLNGRQLALKVSANSVYGFTGAQIGKLPCMQIASSVTSYGRTMIELTKTTVEEKYSKKNGFPWDAQVVYGDTDSVMVKFGTPDLAEAIRLGKEAAVFVTTKFPRPINLEFEKVFFPYLLISKKRYAGLYFNRVDKWDHVDTKGIETVRRDNCLLVKYVIENVLNKILLDSDVEGAINFVKNMISDLLQNKLDLSMLIISKTLSKEDYAGKQAHVELVKRIRERDKTATINTGDRIPYVIIKSTKDAKAYEKAEDPLYVLENNIPIDFDYYIENQLKKPLTRIFKPILGEKVSEIFEGKHTRFVVNITPTANTGIMKFAKVTKRCAECHAVLKKDEGTICRNCHEKTGEIYAKKLVDVQKSENAYHRIMTQCQECMQSHHREIICANKDCPIFYMRVKVQHSINQQREMIENFEW
ncbi:DNA polymerase delta catalytic subunit, putative [Entamoeba dispar SAW760]|uniref:DNA polymerase n=1 Tax=Entamoeba dispar (strain ATCC PRA-260 / SAW760) TaxID=370354 RepID=B0EAZ8_ENTDS|nr:DNA polymerase delta catalytic subunit, putative [Entamoeba dispar SAW760]EDR28305.1 DNA polymerase delta catalytic subunit, putative [Entamoeba dispar SAW760]|eukprot:EDR28305.1 DNA polymerase delta catalytic subunit, putative [Entamoeba dispar SAW760]